MRTRVEYIRPDYCIALRLIALQDMERKQQEFLDKAALFVDPGLLSLITEHASRYSTGSQGRIALETLALEIRERG